MSTVFLGLFVRDSADSYNCQSCVIKRVFANRTNRPRLGWPLTTVRLLFAADPTLLFDLRIQALT
jgi:hypothetical protein